MTTEHVLNRLAESLDLTADQRDRLLPELAAAFRDGLMADGWVGLSPLGMARLGIQREKTFPDGRVLPMRPVVWFRAGPEVARDIETVPIHFAQHVAGYHNGVQHAGKGVPDD